MNQLTNPAQSSWPVVVNENFAALAASAIFSKRYLVTTGLTWGYHGGLYNGNTISDGTVTLTDTSDNYVVVLRSTGVVSTSTTDTNSLNPLYAKLYKLTCAGGVVTVEVDQRQDANGLFFSAAAGATQPLDADLTTISGLTATTDNFMQAKSSAWASRTPAQVAVDLRTPINDLNNVVSALSTSGTVDIDCALGDYFTLAATGDVTSITFSNLPGSGKGASKWIQFTQDSTPRTVAWPASFKWAGGVAGTVSTGSGAVDELAITTVDNGTTWKATLGKAFA